MFARSSAAALNHLLSQNSWALPRLARFAGLTVRFDIAPFSFTYTVLPDGLLKNAEAASHAAASCVIAPSLLPRLALSGANARNSLSAEADADADAELSDENAHAGIQSEGDAELLKEIFFLSRNLNWDAAEDLSHITGDIAAERIVQALHSMHQQGREAAANLSHAAAEYWIEERPLLAKHSHVSEFIRKVDSLRDDMARLEQRINRHMECADMSAPGQSGGTSPHSKN